MEEKVRKAYKTDVLLPIIEEVVSKGGTFRLVVTGTSMTPTLYSNRDCVVLTSPKDKKPKKYDIVFFKRTDGKVVLHRIIKINKNGDFVINGDSQDWTEIIKPSQIIAVVSQYERNGKIVKCNGFAFRFRAGMWSLTRNIRPNIFKLSQKLKSR